MKRIFFVCMAGLLIFSLSACSSGGETAHTSGGQNESGVDSSDVESISGVNKMGAISPEDALTYMKNTPDLVIVEVNAPEWKLSTGFTGAMYIPYTEMAERYDEIPEGRPVLLHCGGGIVSVDAYKILQEKRPDIPELSYIAGAPPVRAYNEWLSGQEINS
jgi:rhodanese-related sulfurtransferase